MPKRADGYQATTGFVDDSTLYDSNTATGYTKTVSTGAAEITVRLDLGASPTAARKLRHVTRWSGSVEVPVWEYSNDGSSWSSPTFSSTPLEPTPDCAASNWDVTRQFSGSTTITARYWRASFRSNDNGDSPCGSWLVGCMEVEALDNSNAHIPEAVTPVDYETSGGVATMALSLPAKSATFDQEVTGEPIFLNGLLTPTAASPSSQASGGVVVGALGFVPGVVSNTLAGVTDYVASSPPIEL